MVRDVKKIKTNWYQKPTWSGLLLNFCSHHPLSYKINVINHLVDRGITLAHITFHKENIQKIKTILLNNNYPINFINHVIKNRINHLHKKNTCTQHPSKGNTHKAHLHPTGQNPKYIPLPYVQGHSEKLSDILKPFNIKIAPCNENNLSNFFKSAKDHISKLDTADVIYNIPYTGCTASYIVSRPVTINIYLQNNMCKN